MPKSQFDQFVNARVEEHKEQLYLDAVVAYLKALPSYNVTLGEFVDSLKNEGAWEYAQGIKVNELADIVRPTGRANGKTGGKRLTKAEKSALTEKIPAYLEANPWSKRKDIAIAMHVDSKKLAASLRDLLASKAIKKQGEKAGTVYAAKGEQSKP